MRKGIIAFSLSLIALLLIAVFQRLTLYDGRLHVVFCDVGQGDAIYIRTPKGTDILIDGGPDKRVLQCLSSHMPFWDREIALVALSHPHADHFVGLIDVFDRYKVKQFAAEDLENATVSFEALQKAVEKEKTTVRTVFAEDILQTSDSVQLSILGPQEKFLRETSPGGRIGETKEFASLVLLLSYGEFDVLFTGDSQIGGLSLALQGDPLTSIEVLQVPHHGSKTGLSKKLVTSLAPMVSVISVGKNRYGHPAKEIVSLLKEQGSEVLRTDEHGDVEIISDGKKWWIK